MFTMNTSYVNCNKLFVSGINAKATLDQIYRFFCGISRNIVSIYNVRSTKQEIQNVVIEFSDHRSVLETIDKINFNVYDGFMMKAYINHPEIFNGIKNDKSNVAIHFPKSFDMEQITERFVFEIMKRFGSILDICVRKDLHMVFCHFAFENSAISAIKAKYDDGVYCRPKTQPKPKQQPIVEKPQQIKLVDNNFPSLAELSKPKNQPIKVQTQKKKPLKITKQICSVNSCA